MEGGNGWLESERYLLHLNEAKGKTATQWTFRMRIVVDTNVLLASLRSRSGASFAIAELIGQRRVSPVNFGAALV
jgi:hypothetical protein